MTTLINPNTTTKGSLKLQLMDDSNFTINYLLAQIWSEFARSHKGEKIQHFFRSLFTCHLDMWLRILAT